MHFTPTSAFWLNKVERFFRDTIDKRIRREEFTNVVDLETTLTEYITAHNDKSKLFIWTAITSDILANVIRARAA